MVAAAHRPRLISPITREIRPTRVPPHYSSAGLRRYLGERCHRLEDRTTGGAMVKVGRVLIVVTLLLALALAPVRAQAPAPQRGGTLRVGITQEILNLDPHVATAFSSVQVFDLVYETLLRFNPKTLEIEPNLAASWSVSGDGLEYTLNLRRDATFHDGSSVDASDVKYTIDRILNPATR